MWCPIGFCTQPFNVHQWFYKPEELKTIMYADNTSRDKLKELKMVTSTNTKQVTQYFESVYTLT